MSYAIDVLRRLFACVGLTLAAASATACDGGCDASAYCQNVTLDESIDGDVTLEGATVSVCQNAVCGTGVITAGAANIETARFEARVEAQATDGGSLSMVVIFATASAGDLVDGDIWSFTISDGTSTAQGSQVLSYKNEQDACGSVCRQAI